MLAQLPEVSGKVRAETEVAGWCFRPHTRGTEVMSVFFSFLLFFFSINHFVSDISSYIAKSNPKGWLPPAVLKLVANSIPLCVAGVRDYLSKFGAPPFVIKLAGEVERSSFEHATSEFSLNFISRPSGFAPVSKIFIPASRYPFGVDVTLKSPSASGKFTKVCLVFCCCLQFC